MAEFYDVLNENEIDGQDSGVTVLETDTIVMSHPPQELPSGNYDFSYSYQVTSDSGNKDLYMSTVGSVALPEMDVRLAKDTGGAYREFYSFNVDWIGGLFNVDMIMRKKDNTFILTCDRAEFSMKRRS